VNLAGFVGVHRDGGYAPNVVLPAGNAIPIPESLDPIAATVIPDAVATPVHVATRAKIGKDDRVAVIGAGGGVGIHMVQVAKLASPHVVGLDVNEPKLAAIESHGVRAIDSTDLTGLGAVFDNGPPTVIVDLLGSEPSAAWSVEALASGGRVVVLTTFRNRPLPIEYRRLVLGEISLLGSRYATKAEVGTAASLVETGRVRPVIGEAVGPATLLDLHTRLRAGELVGRGALSWFD
jgi:propanol-preferring alcohol dehydrogenase